MIPVAGDWDGDGTDGVGYYCYNSTVCPAGTWNLRQTASAGAPDIGPFVFWTGSGSYPVVGDWDADGDDTVGVKNGSTWSLNYQNDSSLPRSRLHLRRRQRPPRRRGPRRHKLKPGRRRSPTPPPSARTAVRRHSTCAATMPTSTADRRRSSRSPSRPTARSGARLAGASSTTSPTPTTATARRHDTRHLHLYAQPGRLHCDRLVDGHLRR